MLEIVLSSFAGMATAVALKKIPKKSHSPMEVNRIVSSQLDSLRIEKELLAKTISQLYQHNSNLTNIQRDRLLVRYQHQLGQISKQIERLEEVSRYPDWGSVGEGLITVMDQKLSQIDRRLHELSSKMVTPTIQVEKTKESKPIKEKTSKTERPQRKEATPKPAPVSKIPLQDIEIDEKPKEPIELITLTSLPKKPIDFPVLQKSVTPKSRMQSLITPLGSAKVILPEESEKQKTVPQEDDIDDSDDLEKIKGEILKTLSKLDEAEVE